MPLQSNYTQYQPAGYPGMHANMEEWNAMTRIASATIPFGAPVQRNGDNGCSPLAAGEYLGIAKAMHTMTGNGDNYAAGDNVSVVDLGVFYGMADAAIVVGDPLKFNTATNRYTTAAASGTVIVVPGAEADTAAASAGAIFKMRLRRVPS